MISRLLRFVTMPRVPIRGGEYRRLQMEGGIAIAEMLRRSHAGTTNKGEDTRIAEMREPERVRMIDEYCHK